MALILWEGGNLDAFLGLEKYAITYFVFDITKVSNFLRGKI